MSRDYDDSRLKRTVLLGYTDICAASSRALLGIDMRIEYYDFEVLDLQSCVPSCKRTLALKPNEQDFVPFQILNCKYEQFSVVVVNTELSSHMCHLVADKILQLCIEGLTEKIILCASLRLDLPMEYYYQKIFENTFFTEPVTKNPSLPCDTAICDAFLNTFLQLIQVEQIPLICFVTPAHRPQHGQANETDGSKQSIGLFQDAISTLTRLRFNQELSCSLVFHSKDDSYIAMTNIYE